ncbi:ashwin isoform X1 [Cephus cinctus]|uniref:Ashwin n=1 Tax=Cephus cinctus TaxID=211228 RepID=A0AAJ7BKG4_CEPCN|nr:ashwin isoform X1 [Cephus cinctus]
MENLQEYQLTRPELLSEETLREVLKNKCIQVPDFKALSKPELIEIFKRVALPLPQRQCSESRYFGRKILSLRIKRSIATATYEDNAALKAMMPCNSTNVDCSNAAETSKTNRLKPIIKEANPTSKKICLSNSTKSKESLHNNIKRKNEDNDNDAQFLQVTLLTDTKKRQKITWP